jgi:hypothetical protein
VPVTADLDVRASWKPTPTGLADDGLVPSLQADRAVTNSALARTDAVRERRPVASDRINVIMIALYEVRRMRNDCKLHPTYRSISDVRHVMATLTVTLVAHLITLNANDFGRVTLSDWRCPCIMCSEWRRM